MSGQELLQTLEALLAANRCDDAISIATTALASDPQDAQLYTVLAAAQLGAGRPADALKAADNAARLDPASERARGLRARALAGLGQSAEPLAAAQEAARLERQKAAALEEMASRQLARGRLADAEATATELIRIAPEWAESFNTRGRVLIRKRKLDQAESDFRAALRLAPDEPTYMNNLGLVLHRRGKRKEAIEWFRNASMRDPSFATARKNLFASTRLYLWGGALVLVLSIALHAAYVGLSGGTNGRFALLVAIGLLALLVPVFLVRYWLRKRSLDPIAQTLYEVESRRARRRPDERTIVRAGGFLLLFAAFLAALLTKQTQLAGLSLVLAILWLHRGWTVWRYASRWFSR